MAREGGAAEPAGEVVLLAEHGRRRGRESQCSILPRSRKATIPMVMRGTTDLTDASDVVTRRGGGYGHVYPAGTSGTGTITLTNVRLDLRDASGHPSRQRSRVIQPPSFPISSMLSPQSKKPVDG